MPKVEAGATNAVRRRTKMDTPSYSVRVSKRFVALSLISCLLVAFIVGRTARIFLIVRPQLELLELRSLEGVISGSEIDGGMKLPTPVLKNKAVPQTSYTSKNFDTAKSASINSRWVVTEGAQQGECSAVDEDECAAPVESPTVSNDITGDDDEPHFPQGQHLLIDIEHVNSAFLNSEYRLASAMLELIYECGLTLLSYHCHSLTPSGVSCAGVLLESHVSFHTWPSMGVITLDLFTCGPNSLLPIVPMAEKLFSVESEDEEAQKPQSVWAHKYRGFSDDKQEDSAELADFFSFPLGIMTEFKEEIASGQTDFQRVDVYDVLRPRFQSLESYQKSLSNDGSYESLHPEFFEPDRIVFLDGILQSRRSGDAAYHEALVHPAMFAHKNPKRVAIIGGGEGATLREVLKHKTVEKVVMIEIDKKMVDMSREYLPFWSDCSNLEGGTKSCFDDPRVAVYYEDAFAWFINNFGADAKDGGSEPFDVLIMDALDPQVQREFVNALYDGGPFLSSLPNSIAEDGVFIGQVGQAPIQKQPSEEHSLSKNRVNFIRTLVELGFESIRDYEEFHCGFYAPWQFIVAFKKYESRSDWYLSESALNLKIHQRLIPSKDKQSTLFHFDGPTMLGYMYPSKASETVFCRRSNAPMDCDIGHGFDPERENVLISALEVKQSSLGENVGQGVFATQDISHNSYIGLQGLINTIYMSPNSMKVIGDLDLFDTKGRYWSFGVASYASAYGHYFSDHGAADTFVDSTIHCFINHACNATNNVGHGLSVSETTAEAGVMPQELVDRYTGRDRIYNPARERQVHFFSSGMPKRNIKAGEELFDNYLGMTGRNLQQWTEGVESLKKQCS